MTKMTKWPQGSGSRLAHSGSPFTIGFGQPWLAAGDGKTIGGGAGGGARGVQGIGERPRKPVENKHIATSEKPLPKTL